MPLKKYKRKIVKCSKICANGINDPPSLKKTNRERGTYEVLQLGKGNVCSSITQYTGTLAPGEFLLFYLFILQFCSYKAMDSRFDSTIV